MGTLRRTSVKKLKEWGVQERQAEQDKLDQENQVMTKKAEKLEAAFMKWLSSFLPPGILMHSRAPRVTDNPANFNARAQITFQLPKCAPVLLSFERVTKYDQELEETAMYDSEWLEGVFRTHWGFTDSNYQMAGEPGDRRPPFIFYSSPYAWTEFEGEEAVGWTHTFEANNLIDAIQKASDQWPDLKRVRKELDEHLNQMAVAEVEAASGPEDLPDPIPPTAHERVIDGLSEIIEKKLEKAFDDHYYEYHHLGPDHD